ncbi:MAG: hypothetical protein QOH24_1516 [Verrucomicrobiota bacterium]
MDSESLREQASARYSAKHFARPVAEGSESFREQARRLSAVVTRYELGTQIVAASLRPLSLPAVEGESFRSFSGHRLREDSAHHSLFVIPSEAEESLTITLLPFRNYE